jgi:ferric-dicitrate binding protein FerR (iron transport regulator)
MKHRTEIETLVERFLEGRTTSSEERELYAWFASADVPEEWHDLKAMFAWYSEGMPETLIEDTTSQPALNQGATTAHAPTPRHATPRRRTIWLSGAAIGTSIAAAIAALLWLTPARPAFDIYEGSYIIEAGVRCDNSDYIRADIEALLKRADDIEQRANMLLAMAD